MSEGRAVAIVGESTRVGLPAELAWLPLVPPVALPVRLLARTLDRAPAVDRLLTAAEEVADQLGWRGHADLSWSQREPVFPTGAARA